MRICFIPGFLYQGGAQRWAVELARDAALRGHDVTLLLDFPTDEPAFYARLPESVKFWYVNPDRWSDDRPDSRSWHARRTPKLLDFVVRHRRELLNFDIVHVVATRLLPFLMVQLKRLTRAERTQFVETYTGYFHELSPQFLRVGIPQYWAHFAAVSAAVDSPTRRQIAARLPHVRMPLIMFGVAAPDLESVGPEERLAYRRAAGVPDSVGTVVGSIQRLHPTRRPWELIDVYASIVRHFGEDVHFIHAGDGPSRSDVEARARAAGIAERMHFLGGVSDVRLPLSILDLHVIQTWEHGIPGASGFEATMAGVPSIGIDYTPYGYTAADSDLIWSSKDFDEVGRRAAALLADRKALGCLAARQRVQAIEQCSPEMCGRRYDDLYREILSAAKRS